MDNNAICFSGIMSEVETSSSRLRRGAKERHSYVGSSARPRTSPSQPSRSPGPMSGNKMINNNLFEDDPGIMSEAETSSTRLKRGSSSNVSMATASLPRGGHVMMVPGNPQHSSMFDDDPGIMSEAETASTRRKNKPKAVLPVVRTPSKTLERPLGRGVRGFLKSVIGHSNSAPITKKLHKKRTGLGIFPSPIPNQSEFS